MNVRENDPWGEKSLGKIFEGIKETRKMLNKKEVIKMTEENKVLEFEESVYTSNDEDVSFIEFGIINKFLMNVYHGKVDNMSVSAYGTTDSIGRVNIGGVFDITHSFWFSFKFAEDDNDYIIQTKIYLNNHGETISQIHITAKIGIVESKFEEIFMLIKTEAFNTSEFKGKCIMVKVKEGQFRGIKIIDIEEAGNELILNATQRKFIDHFINRVGRGGNARYLLNGEPGCGKTESIREIARRLIPNVTFIIPDFTTSDDLTSIMEACEIFENGVIIMDDIDLYLGSRDNGSYTRLLGQFLSFFDGIKKRKISLLASTNDKGLVDKAAERPGRFNLTLDYSYLDDEQIIKVCEIHLPKDCQVQDVYDVLTGRVNGKKVKVTGAFIANLADNIREMSEDSDDWTIDDTVSLITESYKGFYSTQSEKEKSTMGFSN
jgi:SpoVK/Ycf46/Vps4 family AAA+-type ATPase